MDQAAGSWKTGGLDGTDGWRQRARRPSPTTPRGTSRSAARGCRGSDPVGLRYRRLGLDCARAKHDKVHTAPCTKVRTQWHRAVVRHGRTGTVPEPISGPSDADGHP